ncbi:MAG: argininosuccinate lyase [Nitrospirae bacterium]|nr:MAG: argininosuccinate lyase [Nitrospirota bacterium]
MTNPHNRKTRVLKTSNAVKLHASNERSPEPTPSHPSSKPWGGRFQQQTHHLVETFTASIGFDQRLYEHDIRGSIAHCYALYRAKILSRRECAMLVRGLQRIRQEIRNGEFLFQPADEDIHMSIERRLVELVGPVGGKLHTGRSRNDQIALDLRLYLRDTLQKTNEKVRDCQRALLKQARKHLPVVMPGYTHLQRAQPILLSHHLLAYVEMLERDKGRLTDALHRLNVLPLGSGALAGTNYPLDRKYTARLLNFPTVSTNSLDAVSDRDFVIEVLSAFSLLMMHLSRLSEELVLWASQEFQFIELPDAFCTGSSMMPQKKNPDVPELVRGKTGRVFGHLLAVLTMLKGLPLSYNRDLQEDKEPLFDAIDTVHAAIDITTALLKRVKVRAAIMQRAASSGFLLATELADYLVLKGVPFRESHGIVGQLVRYCVEQKKDFSTLTIQELQAVSPHFDHDALQWLNIDSAIDRKSQIGGTARKQVERRLRDWERRLSQAFSS